MNIQKKIIFKFSLVVLLIIVFNYIYTFLFYEKDLQKHSEIINLVKEAVKEQPKIIYLGESSNNTTRGDDNDKRSISAFLGDFYPTIKIKDLTKPAAHAGIFKVLLQNIPESDKSIKTVVVTLNLRSFNANWIYSNLETPLQKSLVLIQNYPPLFNRFLLTFRGYDIKDDKQREKQFKEKWETETLKFPHFFKYKNVIEWDKAIGNGSKLNKDGSWDMAAIELACHYVKTYAFQIDTLTNPRIKDFDEIVALSKERKWKLVFNLLAENTEKANEMVGKELIYLIKQNASILINRYEKKGVLVVNNLDNVKDEEYIDRNWTTEHYAEKGRKIIAKNLADSLKSIYSAYYFEPKLAITIDSSF